METDHNIRGVFWGDTAEKVRDTETWRCKKPFILGTFPGGGHIEYEGILFEDEYCRLCYFFSKNSDTNQYELQRIAYDFKNQEQSKVCDLVSKIEKCLYRKYGDPVTDSDEQPPDKGQYRRWIVHEGQTVIDLTYGVNSFDKSFYLVDIDIYHTQVGCWTG